VRTACPGASLILGDFNLIYQAIDKNIGRLNRRMMNAFRHLISETELQELHLKGRRFTWSNERDTSTLERLDRVLVSEGWMLDHPDHELSALSLLGFSTKRPGLSLKHILLELFKLSGRSTVAAFT